jgi:hypothetical protein
MTAQRAILSALDAGYADFGIYEAAPVSPATLIADLAALGGRSSTYATHGELARNLPEPITNPFRVRDLMRLSS